MNERIKELHNQARDFYLQDDYMDLSMKDLHRLVEQKFAELIVKECVELVSVNRDLAIEDGWNVDEAMSTAIIDIEEHFGVEE